MTVASSPPPAEESSRAPGRSVTGSGQSSGGAVDGVGWFDPAGRQDAATSGTAGGSDPAGGCSPAGLLVAGSGRRAPVWVVAGPPGSGKSTVADLLLRRLNPVPALLDKDVLFDGFVAEVQRTDGRPAGEREGAWYDLHVKAHEYGGMTRAARQIRAAGCPVMLVAPFTGQIRDAQVWSRWVTDLGGDTVHLVWVRSDADTLRARLLARGSERDSGKLREFDRFVGRMLPDIPPPAPHHEIDNRAGAAELGDQVARLCADLARVAGAGPG